MTVIVHYKRKENSSTEYNGVQIFRVNNVTREQASNLLANIASRLVYSVEAYEIIQ